MTNREVLINSLKNKDADEFTVNYIDCVNSPGCKYDGTDDYSPCTDCKLKWLNQEWKD